MAKKQKYSELLTLLKKGDVFNKAADPEHSSVPLLKSAHEKLKKSGDLQVATIVYEGNTQSGTAIEHWLFEKQAKRSEEDDVEMQIDAANASLSNPWTRLEDASPSQKATRKAGDAAGAAQQPTSSAASRRRRGSLLWGELITVPQETASNTSDAPKIITDFGWTHAISQLREMAQHAVPSSSVDKREPAHLNGSPGTDTWNGSKQTDGGFTRPSVPLPVLLYSVSHPDD